ncbi:MAG: hypothetical protein ABSG66_04130 [Stellaceae bacterium]|jgi:hypothetical protein
MKRFIILGFSFWLMTVSNVSVAADVGRYQAVPLSKVQGEFGDRIMILDTITGDLWQWWDAPAMGNDPGRSGITYMGHVKPSATPGETTTFRRFDAPK